MTSPSSTDWIDLDDPDVGDGRFDDEPVRRRTTSVFDPAAPCSTAVEPERLMRVSTVPHPSTACGIHRQGVEGRVHGNRGTLEVTVEEEEGRAQSIREMCGVTPGVRHGVRIVVEGPAGDLGRVPRTNPAMRTERTGRPIAARVTGPDGQDPEVAADG